MELMNLLISYKASVTIIAAYELGVFNILLEDKKSTKDIALELNCDVKLLELLLLSLERLKVLESSNCLWNICKDYKNQIQLLNELGNVINYEEMLISNWNTPHNIYEQIKKGIGNRVFDKQGFDLNEQLIYFSAMNGKNLELLLSYIRRDCKINNNTRFLELGRSIGGMSSLINKKEINSLCDIYLDKDNEKIFNLMYGHLTQQKNINIYTDYRFEFNKKYDCIFIYNTIHYFSDARLQSTLKDLYHCLDKDSLIFIVDIFIDEDNIFNSGVVIDWLTHGGVYNIYIHEIISKVQNAGYKLLKKMSVNYLNSSILLLSK